MEKERFPRWNETQSKIDKANLERDVKDRTLLASKRNDLRRKKHGYDDSIAKVHRHQSFGNVAY